MEVKTVDDSAFFEILGKSQNTKILELFIERDRDQFNFSEVAEMANVQRQKIKEILDIYCKIGLLSIAKERKNRKLYVLNNSNAYAKHIKKIYQLILKEKNL